MLFDSDSCKKNETRKTNEKKFERKTKTEPKGC